MERCVAGGMDYVGADARAAVVLLAREGEGIGRVEVEGSAGRGVEGVEDFSLVRLVEWVERGGDVDLGAGILLKRPSG